MCGHFGTSFAIRATAVSIAAGLAACAGGLQRPVPALVHDLPAAWSAPEGGADAATVAVGTTTSLAAWWLRFNDPLLAGLIDEGLRANPTVRVAAAARAQSRALMEVQRAALLPSLLGTASAQGQRQGEASAAHSVTASLDASWEPDLFGGQRAAVAAARADLLANEASLGLARIVLAGEIAADYIQVRGLQARVAIAAVNLQTQEETLQLTRWRAQAGLLTTLEIEQALAATAQTRALLPVLRDSEAQAEHALCALLGLPPLALQARLAQADPTPAGIPTAPDGLSMAIPAETLRQRPDVRAAEARVTAALHRVRQAIAARLPALQLAGSLGGSGSSLANALQRANLLTTWVASLAMPIVDAGAARAQVRAQRAALAGAAAGYDAAVLVALQEVEDDLAALAGDRDRVAALKTADGAARDAAMLARQRFDSGLIDFQVVLDTQRVALSSQDALASAMTDLGADHVRLYKALGGGWDSSAFDGPVAARNAPQARP